MVRQQGMVAICVHGLAVFVNLEAKCTIASYPTKNHQFGRKSWLFNNKMFRPPSIRVGWLQGSISNNIFGVHAAVKFEICFVGEKEREELKLSQTCYPMTEIKSPLMITILKFLSPHSFVGVIPVWRKHLKSNIRDTTEWVRHPIIAIELDNQQITLDSLILILFKASDSKQVKAAGRPSPLTGSLTKIISLNMDRSTNNMTWDPS